MNQPEEVYWITGASSGIGRALSLIFVKQGRSVAGSAIDVEGLASVAVEAEGLPGRFYSYPLDIRDASKVRETVAEIESNRGPITLAVLGAGVYEPVTGTEIHPDVFRRVSDVNLFGTIQCLAAVVDRMRGRQHGQIALISSLSAFFGQWPHAAYGMTKAALLHVAEALYQDLQKEGIKLQVITPGYVDTPMTGERLIPTPQILSAYEAAGKIQQGLESSSFRISFPRRLSWTVALLRILPIRWIHAIVKRPPVGQ